MTWSHSTHPASLRPPRTWVEGRREDSRMERKCRGVKVVGKCRRGREGGRRVERGRGRGLGKREQGDRGRQQGGNKTECGIQVSAERGRSLLIPVPLSPTDPCAPVTVTCPCPPCHDPTWQCMSTPFPAPQDLTLSYPLTLSLVLPLPTHSTSHTPSSLTSWTRELEWQWP